ncbi:MAG: YvcK family protein [Candidatus Caldatribacterium sp.]|uniref:gluconeogenesis factor YvcK family protein n=1 Tax=Candidatus Caldatribacterium sp. TaxID=2282143 RepID=UPI0029929F30|nr:YvcK family protein [Candidatus Caldatribacterium sp.]MCX7730155.1 YvcK family protein [Candidatus Caldatribacterium sp.]MDW8081759.1 YvcK family protein [Candidatus Calescibacterium sp.]
MREEAFRRFVRWLYPGMRVKRWLMIAVCGMILISLGMSLILSVPTFRGFYNLWRRFVFSFFGHYSLAVVFGFAWIVGGAVLIVWGLQKMNRSIIGALVPERERDVAEVIFRSRQLARGPHVVAIGGGHGLHTLLHGLKEYTANITAIVTVFDDGGSSGKLRRDMGVLPPGDIRNCLIALADAEPLMRDLFQYRFSEENDLKGHNFGNLFIAALTQVTGDFQRAILESSKVLAVRGRVLPTTLANVVLKAQCADGSIVVGESNVGCCGKRIKRIFLDPPDVPTTPEVLKAIEEADLIVLGPGSLYTSVLCNLAVEDVRQAILRSSAPLVFVCNVTTQPGETDGYTFADHLEAVFQFLPRERVNYVLVNGEKPHPQVLEELKRSGIVPVLAEGNEWDFPGKVLEAPLLSAEHPTRHDPDRLAQALCEILLEEKPSFGFYFALHTKNGLRKLKIVRLVSRLGKRALNRNS